MRILKRFIIFICVLAALIFGLYFAFHINTIEIEGDSTYSDAEIEKSVFSRKFSDNELVFRLYNKIYGINKLPLIEDIDVKYIDRNSVLLHVYEKKVSGCIKYMGQYVYFDKDGIVLQSLSEHKEGVPMVTGIKFGDFSIGEAFSVEDEKLFSKIMNISQLISHYKIDVSRIHSSTDGIILYSGKVRVYLGKKNMYDDQLAALSSVLKTTEKKNLKGSIDMSDYQSGDKIVLKTNN